MILVSKLAYPQRGSQPICSWIASIERAMSRARAGLRIASNWFCVR